ncbi:unnamed protein product [Allacma fusca]|uniref:Uncharacterized protein n=1 Tax=Allacma fusca TaxID=39272 RepID=A0A8J2J5M2_9HEXA|nr:unnamed protein product [Allacma fusca]
MGNTDSVPVVSQMKSLVQYIGGDSAAALSTQQNFAYNNTFPVISQIASAGYAIGGDLGRAKNLQEKFAKDMESVIDSIPVAGHIKGSVHFAMGDNEKGENAMKSASRSTGVVLGGVGGFAAGGPVGAVAGGIAGGAAVDGIITGSEILAHGPTARPYGYIAAGHDIAQAIQGKKNITTEQGFDMAMVPISDGLGGYSAGRFIGKPLGLNVGGSKSIPVPGVRGGYRGGGAIVSVLDDAALTAKQGAAGAANAGNIVKAAAGNSDDVLVPAARKSNFGKLGLDKASLDNRAKQLNPNNPASGPGRPAGYQGAGTKLDLDNHANQLNPNHPAFTASRGGSDVVAPQVD